jgi:hypothetical protein
MSQQLKKKFIGNDQIDGDKLLLEDGQAVRAMDGATEVELAKITLSEVYLNGFKILQSSGLIPSDRLPSYVDDVLEFANLAAFPVTGETGKIYIALDNNKQYRWSGSVYVQITSGAVDSVNGETGVVVLDASDISVIPTGNLAASDTQAALEELQGDIDTINTTLGGLSFNASAISVTPAGDISSTNVQAALEELDSEKVAKAGDSMQGQLTMESADIVVDYSAGAVTETLSLQQGIVSSVYVDALDSWSTEIYAGGETIARTSADSSTSDVSVTITATHNNPIFSAEITDYENNRNGSTAIDIDSINFEYGDNSNGDFFSGGYGSQVFSISKVDGVTAENRVINASISTGTITAYSDTGSGPQAIMPTLDYELAPKKYVDDQYDDLDTQLTNHLNDAADAHDASAISVAAGITNLAATDVQGALSELQDDVDGRAVVALSNLAATTAINSDLTFSRGAGVTANIRGKTLVPGEASGALQVFSGSVTGGVSSGQLNLFSGNIITSTTGDSGNVNINSGNSSNDPASTSQSGQVFVKSGNTVNGASGIAVFKSGDTFGTGNSGPVAIGSGDSASGSAGNVAIFAGVGAGSVRGFVSVEASKLSLLNVIDMNSHQINELADGTLSSDAVNKGQLDSGLALKLNLSGGTMSGNIAMGNNSITNLTMTSDSHSAATKEYVDTVAEGLHVHAPARLVRSSAIVGSYDNGVGGVGAKITPTSPVSNIDGILSFAIGQRIVVRAQANSWENGIYTVSAIDGSNHVTEFTRATDFNTAAEAAGGDFIFVQQGNTYADTGWVQTKTTTALGFGVSDPIEFLQFSGAGSYQAGDGLDLTGTIFSVNVSEIAGAGLEDDGSNNLRIASSAAGDGIDLAAGVLSVNAGDGIQILSDAVAVNVSDFAGDGLENNMANDLKIKLTTDSGLQVGPSGLSVASSLAGDGLSFVSAGVLSVNVNDIAGAGLQEDGSGNLRIELDVDSGLEIDSLTGGLSLSSMIDGDGLDLAAGVLSVKLDGSSLSVSPSGLKTNIGWYKESYAITSTLTSGAFFDLDHAAEVDSISAFVDRLAIHEGASLDYSVSYTGGTGGVTRITFLNALVSPGQQQLSNGDTIFFKYQRKLA